MRSRIQGKRGSICARRRQRLRGSTDPPPHFTRGTAASSSRVYSARGRAITSAGGPISSIRPARRTSMRSERYSTTAMLWVISRTPMPLRARRRSIGLPALPLPAFRKHTYRPPGNLSRHPSADRFRLFSAGSAADAAPTRLPTGLPSGVDRLPDRRDIAAKAVGFRRLDFLSFAPIPPGLYRPHATFRRILRRSSPTAALHAPTAGTRTIYLLPTDFRKPVAKPQTSYRIHVFSIRLRPTPCQQRSNYRQRRKKSWGHDRSNQGFLYQGGNRAAHRRP